ncbi:MAG: mannitol dehydrogenase family protein [Planctomycetota bacterium]|jgi:mannitol-1-phosphate 5-dehydrogenase
MGEHVFTGFGFGPIQSGLFAAEAFASGNFSGIVVAEIDRQLVQALRANKGSYYVNVARADGIESVRIDGVELLDPNDAQDRILLSEAIGQSTEIATSLPSVNFYESGGENSVASLVTEGIRASKAKGTIIYTAENNNHAAEILEKLVAGKIGTDMPASVQFLNTVIGKMSRVVHDAGEIAELGLKTIAPGIERAFLVEEFNRILVSRARISGFTPGIEVFIEKNDLLPFEEAKLYGHNAVHALLGFIGSVKGYASMTELKDDRAVMRVARDAFLGECGAALVKKYHGSGDELFTEEGFRDYAEDLLERMTNPYLGDTTARAGRDAVRKLGINDRIFGTMQLALEYGIEPVNMATGAIAGIAVLIEHAEQYDVPAELRFENWWQLGASEVERILNWVWGGETSEYTSKLVDCTIDAGKSLADILG